MAAFCASCRGPATVLLLAFIAGCASDSLIGLENEWARTYVEHLRAGEEKRDYLTTGGDYEVQFANLADRAAEAGDETVSSDPSIAIGFYRIAALAAWKSAGHREDKVPDLVAKGIAACDSLPDKAASQPRDCALFQFVEYFSLFDQKLRSIGSFIALSHSRPDKDLPVDQLETASQLHEDLGRLFNDVEARRSETSSLAVSASFHHYVKQNWKAIYCSAADLSNVMLPSLEEGPYSEAVTARTLGMQDDLRNAGVSVVCAALGDGEES